MKIVFLFVLAALSFACSSRSPSSPTPAHADQSAVEEKKTVRQVMPLTYANMKGHKQLYNEGWYIVSSSEKAFSYAKEQAVYSSGEALEMAKKSIGKRSSELGSKFGQATDDGIQTGKKIHSKGAKISSSIYKGTDFLVEKELRFGEVSFQSAWQKVTKGNLSIVERTEKDREQISSFGNYVDKLDSDFKNIDEIAAKLDEEFSIDIKSSWNGAFKKAVDEFNKEYEESGESANALTALGDIFQGYFKSFYYSLIEPSAGMVTEVGKAAGNTVKVGSKKVAQAIFLPVAKATVLTGRTVQSTGLTLYYGGKIGLKLVSPTVEAGFLTGLGILSYTTIPFTLATGKAAGVVNQVAFSTTGVAAGVGEAAGKSIGNTLSYAAL
ncbi:MAG: hypothetical protein GY786_23335, partial [Proteobacteria bacterium]|nr:hypothetical protein [Pseudomonadota bacterium]